MPDPVELLFFDTFAHDNTEEINLDLVQFPKPVHVTEVRIIPLGARVQADFPGGVRLGATNPSQFQIEFFVNDLGKPGASTFESLGGFEYNQNGCINLDCVPEDTVRKIPTDGLVLRGWYTTITLAVYGTLTNNIAEQIIQPVVNPALPTQPNTIADAQQLISSSTIENEWTPQETIAPVPIEYNQSAQSYPQNYTQPAENYNQEYSEYYNDVPKDPRSYHHTPETDWDTKGRSRTTEIERDRERERDRSRDLGYQKTGSIERDHSRPDNDRRERSDRDKTYTSRSHSHDRDRDRQSREYSRDRDDYHDYYDRDRDRRDRDRERDRKRDDTYRRPYVRDDREERKRPRTPPQSPKRPHTPHKEPSPSEVENFSEEELGGDKQKSPPETKDTATPPVEEAIQMDVEEFEPILSDEDILDDNEHYDIDYDYSAYTNNDDLIKVFVAGVTPLKKYEPTPAFVVNSDSKSVEINEHLKTTIGIVDDYFKSSITKYVLDDFEKLNTEIKEEFIHLCEKLIGIFGCKRQFCDILQIFTATKSLNVSQFHSSSKELLIQVHFIVEALLEWLKIALDYKMANVQDQPAYKIRHIKCGVRLAEWCCASVDFIEFLWQSNFNIHDVLLKLYDQEYMALSIKLMILKTLDAYLLHKFAIEKFLFISDRNCKENGFSLSKNNGYKILVGNIRKNPLVRLKFALNSILKKINLYEILNKLHNVLVKLRQEDVTAVEIDFITKSLDQILSICQTDGFVLSQPKRFLPVSAQFEILRQDTRTVLINFFAMFNLLECFLLLLTSPSTLNLPTIKTPIFEILSMLLKNPEGLEYLRNNCETLNPLLKCLLQTDEEMQYSIHDCIEIKSHNLGLEIAYKLQALYHIHWLINESTRYNCDFDCAEIIEHLHGLFCLTFSHIGKISCADVLGTRNNMKCLLQFLEIGHKSDNQLLKLKKSPGIGYVIDLINFTVVASSNVDFLEFYLKDIQHVINQSDLFEESSIHRINEMKSFLSPLENVTLSWDNISHFVEIANKSMDTVTMFPGQLVTSLRIIHNLGVSTHGNLSSVLLSENPLIHYVELKYKHVILQLFSHDGIGMLTKILQKLCDFYEQPSLHTSTFVSNQAFLILSVVEPCVDLLKHMLTYVIQCRNTDFRDLTSIPTLLQTYNLLNAFPTTSSCFLNAQATCRNIVDTLLVYTQPVSDKINEKDSLNKTLWTLMIGEVIKYVTSAPYTFMSGLLIFSELLPLPLPLQSRDNLDKDEISWVVNLRKLWSAHLHPHSGNIQELICRLCTTSHQQLLNLLRRVCVQLTDLAANSALMIARGVLDTVHEALVVPCDDVKLNPCTGQTARLLNFLACLVTHGTFKCAVLHLIHSNDKFPVLITTFAQLLKTSSCSNSHIQGQECILSIFQSFCDIEITLLQNSVDKIELTSDIYLANALPTKEHLLMFIATMIDHLLVENSFVTYLPVVRTFLLLTEHDYGFYLLREHLIKRNDVFVTVLNKLAKSFAKDNAECLATLNTLVEFLRVSVSVEEVEGSLLYTPRSMKLTLGEIKGLVSWKGQDDGEEKHPLIVLEQILQKLTNEDIAFESLLEGVSAVVKLLEKDHPEITKDNYSEPVLVEPESLLVQFSGRTIFTTSDACDERLTIRYWLATPADDVENDLENVTCDLSEIVRQQLPSEFNIIKEIEKRCRINPSDGVDEKVKHDDPKTKIKKPFVTPMRARGFPRTIQQRSDLFRSRPPNTSRPPSLHVDDFVALETCGAQPTGPTGYNKFSRELLASTRIARGTRGRTFVTSERSVQCRQMSWWGAGLGRGPYQ